MTTRRQFSKRVVIAAAVGITPSTPGVVSGNNASPGKDVFTHIVGERGQFDLTYYRQLLGAANTFKEGDHTVGVAAEGPQHRNLSRHLLANTRIRDIDRRPPFQDDLYAFITKSHSAVDRPIGQRTLGELKQFLLTRAEPEIKSIMPSLSSDVIACVVKLMSNAELTQVGSSIFNPLPGSNVGARGYLGARVQPNSPTDHPDDIRWQVFDAFSYAVGDVLLGTNPVSSASDSVAQVELTLKDILATFDIASSMPHCVLSHIDVQSQVERKFPDSTALWFQSIGGTDGANKTFDLTLEKMIEHARARTGDYGLYFETGQGADFTNGHGNGFDMLLHESRKYGFARALKEIVKSARGAEPWVHLNDVAGFIGPEVFRTREQLVRCCLEDIVMGKLHGLCIGLDVCSTLHMDISLDDLDWCLDQIAPAGPAYLMALPTKIDPMLGYLTTGYQDHVRLREKHGYRVNDSMWSFFQQLGVIDVNGRPTPHFGDPTWVYLQFQRRKGDNRKQPEILREGRHAIEQVRSRGVFIAEGFGSTPATLATELSEHVHEIYEDGKRSIWTELTADFVRSVDQRIDVVTQSKNREDYILHPESGEQLSKDSQRRIRQLKSALPPDTANAQIVISDGLNADAIMDAGHLQPFLRQLRRDLETIGFQPSKKNILVQSGRVRAGYRIGELLFGGSSSQQAIVHVIGERPGTGHHTFSAYLTCAFGRDWGQRGKIDHNITKVVSGMAVTALDPVVGAAEAARILKTLKAA